MYINRGARGQRVQARDWNRLRDIANSAITNITADNSIQIQQFGNNVNLSQPIHEFDAILGDSFQQDNGVWAHSWQVATPTGDGLWTTGPSMGNGDMDTTPAYAYNGTSASSGTPVRMYAGSQNEFYFTNGGSGGGVGTPIRILLDHNCEDGIVQKTYACILAERVESSICEFETGSCNLFDFYPSQYEIIFPTIFFGLRNLRASSSIDPSSSSDTSSSSSSTSSSSSSSSSSSTSSSCDICEVVDDTSYILTIDPEENCFWQFADDFISIIFTYTDSVCSSISSCSSCMPADETPTIIIDIEGCGTAVYNFSGPCFNQCQTNTFILCSDETMCDMPDSLTLIALDCAGNSSVPHCNRECNIDNDTCLQVITAESCGDNGLVTSTVWTKLPADWIFSGSSASSACANS
jgi:hypothetical protein